MFGYDTGWVSLNQYKLILIHERLLLYRVINGVKDTDGFRETFLNESRHTGNGSREESVRESTLLVNTPPHIVDSYSSVRHESHARVINKASAKRNFNCPGQHFFHRKKSCPRCYLNPRHSAL